MCSTCDYTKYEEFEEENNGRVIKRLKYVKGFLDMTCDLNGSNFKIGKSTIYRCPICGRQLFENYMAVRRR